MILASIVLKIGVYGAIKIGALTTSNPPFRLNTFLIIVIITGGVGGLLLSVIRLRLVDIKVIVALSSIVHMGPCIVVALGNNSISAETRIIIIVGHGMISPCIFIYTFELYNKIKTRALLLSLGLLKDLFSAQIL